MTEARRSFVVFRHQVRAAFTLVEMLVVIAVIGLITAAVVPMVNGTLVATRLSSAGQTIVSVLGLAHEMAVSGGEDIEVRFYRYTPEDEPGANEQYRAIVLAKPSKSPQGAALQIGEIIRCPSGIVIGDSRALSPVLTGTQTQSKPDGERFIRSTTAYYRAFRFRADGTTTLTDLPNQCYFTMAEEIRLTNGGADVPPNFFAIQIDPQSGRLSTYRP